MDLLAGLFGVDQRDDAFLLRSQLQAPFSLTLADGSPLTVVVAARGPLVVEHPTGRHQVPEGGVVLVRGDRPWSLADRPGAPATAVVHPGQRCESLAGEPLSERWSLGVRTWGNADDDAASHVFLVGVHETVPESGRCLLDALPGVLVVPDGGIDPGLLELLSGEIVRDDIAQSVVLTRTLDLVVVLAVRHWMHEGGAADTGVLRGLADPVVGAAIRLLQADPARRWTIQSLAREVGVSRAGLAKRFTELVGTAPIAFLTDLRLALAADRLVASREPIAGIAEEVGYGSAFALSTAFKRRYGVSPQRFRVARAP